jgi:hypothetical protein
MTNFFFITKKFNFFIYLLRLFKNKEKIYFYDSYIIDDYRKLNQNNLSALSHEEEQYISFNAMKLTLKNNFKLINKIKKNNYIVDLAKSMNDKRIYLLFNSYLFPTFYDYYKIDEVKNFIKKKYKKNLTFVTLDSIQNTQVYKLFFLFLLIFKFLLKNINWSQIFKKNNVKIYDFMIQINNPLLYKQKKNILQSREDSQLIKILQKKNSVLLLESQWGSFSEETNSFIKKNKLDISSDTKIKINFYELISIVLPDLFSIFFLILRETLKLKVNFFLISYARVRLDLLRLRLFFKNTQAKNFISRDDFASIHILRTIILEKEKFNHIGISHSNFLHPYTTFLNYFKCYTKYFVTSSEFCRLFSNYYKVNQLVSTGSFYGYNIKKNIKNNLIKEKIIKKYGKNKNIILLLLSSIDNSSRFDKLEINYNNLKNIFKILDFDPKLIFVISPRNKINCSKFVKSLNCYSKYKNRIYINFKDFTSHQLMAHSKYIITAATSSSIFEAFYNSNAVIIPLNMRSILYLAWRFYPNIKIFKNSDELVENFIKFRSKTFLNKYKLNFKYVSRKFIKKHDPLKVFLDKLNF